MTHKKSVLVTFENSRVAVHWEGHLSSDVIKFLFKTGKEFIPGKVDASFTLKGKKSDELICYRNDELIFRGSAGKAAAILLDTVIYELAKKCSGGLLFHAAALSRKGCGILLPGQSGSGKTLLSAWLTRQGYNYLTDEMALVGSRAFCINGFYKPLHIKDAAFSDLNTIIEKPDQQKMHPNNGMIPIDQGFLVDSSCLNPGKGSGAGEAKTGVIIFPEYKYGKKFEMIRLSPAKTGLLLMENLINARNLPSHGFDQIALLARKVPAYAMTYENFSRIFREITSMID